MAHYVDGFVMAIPKKNVKFYRSIAAKARKVWLDHGAVDYRECVGEDLKVKGVLSFNQLAKVKPGETVGFAYIVFKSRAHRDRVNAKVMKDPRMDRMAKAMQGRMPFDMKRMAYGGFKTIVGD